MAVKNRPTLKKLLKVRLPYKSPPPGQDSVMGYSKKYGQSIEKQTDGIYSVWMDYAIRSFLYVPDDPNESHHTAMTVEPLEVYEQIHFVDAYSKNTWEVGGKQELSDVNADGGNYYKYHGGSDYPYTVFRIAEYYSKSGFENDKWWDGPIIVLTPPPVDANMFMPLKDFILARHNLILRGMADVGYKHLDELEVITDKKGFVLRHIPSGKTAKMYDDTTEGHRRVPLSKGLAISIDADGWEVYLHDRFGIPLKDAGETVGQITEVDPEELEVQHKIDAIENEMFSYMNLHPDVPRDFTVVVDLIKKRKEYGNLLRQRDSLIRENPSTSIDRTEYERLLRVVPRMRSGKNKNLAASIKKAYPKYLEEALNYFYSGPLEMVYDETQDRTMSNERLGIMERVYAQPTMGEIIWVAGGDERFSNPNPYRIERYLGAGAFKSSTDKKTGKMVFPYTVVELASATHSRMNKQDIISIHFNSPIRVIEHEGDKGACPLGSIYIDRFNLILQYGYVHGFNPHFKELVFIDGEDGPVLKHIPSGKTVSTFKADGEWRIVPSSVILPVAPKYWEEWLYETLGIEPTDEPETTGEIEIEDLDLLDLEHEIERLEKEMLAYSEAHPEAPRDYASLSAKIGKRKEYGNLLRQRDSLIRENPKKWSTEEFFTERELAIEKHFDYSYYVDPERYEPSLDELDDPEYDQAIADEKMYDEQDLKASVLKMEAEKAVAMAVTDDEKRSAALKRLQANQAAERADQSRYGYWEPDPRSSKTEETQFLFEYYDDGELAESAVESAASYLRGEGAYPLDSKEFSVGMNYRIDTDSDGEWDEEVTYELVGDWTPEEEEHIWHLVQGHKDHKLVYPAGSFGGEDGDENADVMSGLDPEELETQQGIDAIEREMFTYMDSHPDIPRDFAVVSDLIGRRKEYGNLLRKRDSLIRENPRRNPDDESSGDAKTVSMTTMEGTYIWENDKPGSELLDIDYEEGDREVREFVDDEENDVPAWMQAAMYILVNGGGYDYWGDDLIGYRSESFDNYQGPPEESYYDFYLSNWTERELQSINDYIMMERGGRKKPLYPMPSDTGSEHIADIDLADDEFVRAQKNLEAFEQELAVYRRSHPDAQHDDGALAVALGRGKEYGKLLRERDRLFEENPSGIKPNFWYDQPLSRQPDTPLHTPEFMVDDNLGLINEFKRAEPKMMDLLFRRVSTGYISMDRPAAHYERVTLQDWSGAVFSRWTLALNPKMLGNSGNTLIAGITNILPDGRVGDLPMLHVYGLSDFKSAEAGKRALVVLDRLTRIFYHGYYNEGYPILGLIRIGLVTDVRGERHLTLFHKGTGARIDLGNADTLGENALTDQCVVRIPLSGSVEEAMMDADVLFGRMLKPIVEEVGEITSIDKMEQSIQNRIDEIELEMTRYVQLHPYEPNDPSYVINKLGKRVEYSWLLRQRTKYEDD